MFNYTALIFFTAELVCYNLLGLGDFEIKLDLKDLILDFSTFASE